MEDEERGKDRDRVITLSVITGLVPVIHTFVADTNLIVRSHEVLRRLLRMR